MTESGREFQGDYPFEIVNSRFDQKNEVFKRSIWDEKMRPAGNRFYREAVFQEKAGFRQIDYALRNGAWNLERGAGFGNSRGNSGLYAWEGVNPGIRHFIEAGKPVQESPLRMSRIIKKAALYYGADDVGICGLHPNWVYSHEFNTQTHEHYPIEVPEGCRNAIVIALAMDYETIRMSPTGPGDGATGLGYSKMVYVANLLAIFIRSIGYRAIPCGNDSALSVPLAMAAGLGEVGRNGILINRKFGPRVRICKVFTDTPLEHDSYRELGVKPFCETCMKCAKHCPGRAISEGEMTMEGPNISSHSGVLKWYVDGERCFNFWAKNRMSCANCIRVCPFNKPSGILHEISRVLIRKTSRFNRFLVWIDDALGYHKALPAQRFWDDLKH